VTKNRCLCTSSALPGVVQLLTVCWSRRMAYVFPRARWNVFIYVSLCIAVVFLVSYLLNTDSCVIFSVGPRVSVLDALVCVWWSRSIVFHWIIYVSIMCITFRMKTIQNSDLLSSSVGHSLCDILQKCTNAERSDSLLCE
jgi:hypothetical protein